MDEIKGLVRLCCELNLCLSFVLLMDSRCAGLKKSIVFENVYQSILIIYIISYDMYYIVKYIYYIVLIMYILLYI